MNEILIVKLSSIGDTVHAVPAVAALKEAFPDTRITWCVEPLSAALIHCLTCVDKVVVANTKMWRRGKSLLGEGGLPGFIRELRSKKFNQAIDFQGLVKSAVVVYLSKASNRIGWAQPYLREKTARWFYSQQVSGSPDSPHVIDLCAMLLRPLGINTVKRCFPYKLPAEAEEKAVSFTRSIQGRPFIIMNPGSAWETKRWPAEKYAQLMQKVAQELNYSVLVTAGPNDTDLLKQIYAITRHFFYLKTELTELAALCRRAVCFVGGDTGPMHIASAMDTPVLAMFGPTDPARSGPVGPADIVLSKYPPCMGCRRKICSAKHCMDFTVEEVFAGLKHLLTGETRHARP